jgi:hypothetical protein
VKVQKSGAASTDKSCSQPKPNVGRKAVKLIVLKKKHANGVVAVKAAESVGRVSTAGSSNSLRSRPVQEARNATVPEKKRRGTVVQKKKKKHAGRVSTAEWGKLPNPKLARAACHVSVPEMKRPEIAPAENQQPDRRRGQLAGPKATRINSCR